ncbi:hypothetical protein MKJ04_22365 [Pontibacter sp. E15-1]|uniref:hypothetical protein n=1 Tax=Pontibacter sp. E15-1 TaxID=2919918 RepID=UPI001F4F49B1|nr:hypothetical protein [Pontibacter sp. E15-1]MCJ8167604.1 hypothetical protein [Pontibacter sp. E15-1]
MSTRKQILTAMLIPLSSLLPLLLSFVMSVSQTLYLQQDITQDYARLARENRYFISDNSTQTPSLETVARDLLLFQLAASLDLTQATHSSHTSGNHRVDVWQFAESEITSIYQIESKVHLDTVVTQRFLDNVPPRQQRITNDFTFRSYAVATAGEPQKLYYLTEADQGLLAYRLGEKEVQINYSAAKEGLADVLEGYKKEIAQLLKGDAKAAK